MCTTPNFLGKLGLKLCLYNGLDSQKNSDPKIVFQNVLLFFRSAIMTPRNTSSIQASSNHQQLYQSPAFGVTEPAKIPEVVQDRYAALKDLDDIFKNTVVVTDGNTTGTSIFGSSPLAQAQTQQTQQQPSAQAQISPTTNVFGPSPTNGLVGKKHALKKYDKFALNTSCFWESTRSNITPFV